jgi:hypothetical protein
MAFSDDCSVVTLTEALTKSETSMPLEEGTESCCQCHRKSGWRSWLSSRYSLSPSTLYFFVVVLFPAATRLSLTFTMDFVRVNVIDVPTDKVIATATWAGVVVGFLLFVLEVFKYFR